MALKTKKRSKRSGSNGKSEFSGAFQTGMSASDLKKELDSKSNRFDPERLMLYDQDSALVAFVTKPEEWTAFGQHFIQGKGSAAGYRVCTGDGCVLCDEGISRSDRVMIGVHVVELYQAARGDYKAKRTKNMGNKYFVCNKELNAELLMRAQRRGGRLNDVFYTIMRSGDGTDTKYILERESKKVPSSLVRGWKGSTLEKLQTMAREEAATVGTRRRRRSQDDDDDYEDEDFDYDEEDDDEEEFATSRRRRSSNGRSRSSGRTAVRRRSARKSSR
jgi:hypothetical protein